MDHIKDLPASGHRQELVELLIASPSLREQISEATGLQIADDDWPRVVEIFIDFLGLYDGERLKADWRERIARGGDVYQ